MNPILQPDPGKSFDDPVGGQPIHWEERNVLNPTAIIRNDKVYLIYRAQDSSMTSRLGLAISDDGIHFRKQANPLFFPVKKNSPEWPGGVEDPRIVELEDETYLLTYTAYDGKTARLMLASSTDLMSWQRHGPVLSASRYAETWSKSGAIVVRQEGVHLVATKIKGRYWMYFGDTNLFLASSEDGFQWQVEENVENGRLISVLHPRPGFFDSRLVEPGPYALLTTRGIVLIYNASNAVNRNDPGLPKFTYAAGEALFDGEKPWKLLDRSENYFIHPDKSYERTGEVNEVCFVEGLVPFHSRWFLYYGTADSRIAVAIGDSTQIR